MTDERIREALRALRSGDAVPSFDAVVRRRPARRRWSPSPLYLGLAAAVVIVAALGYRVAARLTAPPPLELPREVALLSAYRPMTDVLLNTPGRGVLQVSSPLGASIITVNVGELR